MKAKMIKTEAGSPDGIKVVTYEAGVEYDLPEVLYNAFKARGSVYETKVIAPQETAIIEPKAPTVAPKKKKKK